MAIFIPQPYRTTVFTSTLSVLFKLLLLSSIIVSVLTLSACQTVPSSPSVTQGTVTPMSASVPTSDSAETTYQNEYPLEPYIPPNQLPTPAPVPPYTIPSYPTTNNDANATNPLTQQNPVNAQELPTIPSNGPVYFPDVTTNEPSIDRPTIPANDDYMISQPSALPSHSDLLEQARQNSRQQGRKTTSDRSDLPAFRNLMQVGTSQLKAGNLTAAENSFTRAQRLAPRSSAVYFYLSQVALKKSQPRKAEAMARRGLSVSQDASRRRALWQLILTSGQLQNNSRVVQEAQQALR